MGKKEIHREINEKEREEEKRKEIKREEEIIIKRN